MGSKWLSTSLSKLKFWGSKRSCCQQEKTFEFHSVLRKNRGKKERNLLTFNPQMKCWMSVNKMAHFLKRSKPFQVLAVRVEYLSQHCKRCWWWLRQQRWWLLLFVCSKTHKTMLYPALQTVEAEKRNSLKMKKFRQFFFEVAIQLDWAKKKKVLQNTAWDKNNFPLLYSPFVFESDTLGS